MNRSIIFRILPAAFLASFAAAAAHASMVTPGNLILSVNEFTGSSSAPRYLAEYTTAGARLQTFAPVPQPGGATPTTDTLRDVTFGPGNAISLYNGTFTPTLTRLDLSTDLYSQQTLAGFSTINNTTFGGLAQQGQFVFATDQATGGGAAQGIVRFDTAGGPANRFALTIQPLDLNVGMDGLLYALDGAGLPNPNVYKYDPQTFSLLAVIPTRFEDNRALAVVADGSIFVATSGGSVRHYSPTGLLLDSLTVPGAFFSDIDIDGTGRIALGTAQSGEVIITDVTLDSFSRFRATTSTLGGSVFVSWVAPIPEPSTALFGCALLSVLGGRRNRRLRN